jgi:hypothetical protein
LSKAQDNEESLIFITPILTISEANTAMGNVIHVTFLEHGNTVNTTTETLLTSAYQRKLS